MSIQLGEPYRNTINGFTGVATAVTYYFDGSASVLLTPTSLKEDGTEKPSGWFPANQVEVQRRPAHQQAGEPAQKADVEGFIEQVLLDLHNSGEGEPEERVLTAISRDPDGTVTLVFRPIDGFKSMAMEYEHILKSLGIKI